MFQRAKAQGIRTICFVRSAHLRKFRVSLCRGTFRQSYHSTACLERCGMKYRKIVETEELSHC